MAAQVGGAHAQLWGLWSHLLLEAALSPVSSSFLSGYPESPEHAQENGPFITLRAQHNCIPVIESGLTQIAFSQRAQKTGVWEQEWAEGRGELPAQPGGATSLRGRAPAPQTSWTCVVTRGEPEPQAEAPSPEPSSPTGSTVERT